MTRIWLFIPFYALLIYSIPLEFSAQYTLEKFAQQRHITPRRNILLRTQDFAPIPKSDPAKRANAAIVILVRNRERDQLIETLENFKQVFNDEYDYPFVFLNDEPFTEAFKEGIKSKISEKVEFGLIPESHWSYPPWINQTYAAECRAEMGRRGVIYGGSESYRHMCRYNSGFFFRHPLLEKYDFYWRIEPTVRFLCKLDFDPFVHMQEEGKKYSFVISFKEYQETIPTLWDTTKEYMEARKLQPSWFNFFKDERGEYNLCHFWSNFEIGDLRYFRSSEYIDYFDYLDKKGGFFYERWGDAPVHSLAAGLLLKKSEVLFFNDIGYYHNPYSHCPSNELFKSKCKCDIGYQSDEVSKNSCVSRFINYTPERSEYTPEL
jgi:alpha 1,2-mannosyltransferase